LTRFRTTALPTRRLTVRPNRALPPGNAPPAHRVNRTKLALLTLFPLAESRR
jgi:hypothetical protein